MGNVAKDNKTHMTIDNKTHMSDFCAMTLLESLSVGHPLCSLAKSWEYLGLICFMIIALCEC